MERSIQELLEEAGNSFNADLASTKDQTPIRRTTPETYLGKGRMDRFASKEPVLGGEQLFTLPAIVWQDNFAYGGIWNVSDEEATAKKGSVLVLDFRADKVFLVISPNAVGDKIKVFLDKSPVNDSNAGSDVKDGEVILDVQRLYNIIDLKGKFGPHVLKLEFENDGISVYAFTFG